METPVLIIGIGNDYRGDDAAGLAVIRALEARQLENVQLMECDGNCTTLLEAWKCASTVILVDAAISGSRAGTITRFDVRTQPLPARYVLSSTHALGIAETLALAQVLGQLPPCLIVYGIEGKNFNSGGNLSPAVRKAIRVVVEQVILDIRQSF